MLSASLVLAAAIVAPEITADAKPTLDRLFSYYKSLPGASMKLTMKAPFPGMPDQTSTFTGVKPNQFTVQQDMGMDMGDLAIVCDGTTLWMSESKVNKYSEQPAPKDFSDMDDILPMGGFGDVFFTLLSPNPVSSLLEDMSKVEAGGTKTINGKTYDVVVMHPDTESGAPQGLTFELVVQQGKDAWLYGGFLNLPAEATGGMAMTIEIRTADWKVLKAGQGSFAFKPADGAEKVDDLIGALLVREGSGGPGGPGGGDTEIHEMTGKPAPDFSLKDLNGKTVTLASLKGKTVILDFFATWCGPCKQGMPVLMDIAKARASDDVVLVVVDIDEPADKISRFLKSRKWDLNVLLTGESKVAEKYKVGGIPHTVVIGPDGTIQLIEIGFSGKSHTEKVINEAIDKARSGKVANAA